VTSMISVEIQQFGRRLARHRKAQGLTQKALAAKAGYHQPSISAIENGSNDPRLSTVLRLARALKIRPEKLLKGR